MPEHRPALFAAGAMLIAVLTGGCAGTLDPNLPPLQTVDQVDLDRYSGRWHEVARLPNRFQKGCYDTTADYSLRDDGRIGVVNRCRTEKKDKEARGKAKVVAESGNAQLRVSFFGPFYGDYWIIDLDEAYQWAIVGAPSRKYLWILSREPSLPEATLTELKAKLPAWGYDPAALIVDNGARR